MKSNSINYAVALLKDGALIPFEYDNFSLEMLYYMYDVDKVYDLYDFDIPVNSPTIAVMILKGLIKAGIDISEFEIDGSYGGLVLRYDFDINEKPYDERIEHFKDFIIASVFYKLINKSNRTAEFLGVSRGVVVRALNRTVKKNNNGQVNKPAIFSSFIPDKTTHSFEFDLERQKYLDVIEDFKNYYIESAIEQTDDNIAEASRLFGMSKKTIYRRKAVNE